MQKLIKLVKSSIHCVSKQKANLVSLRLHKIGDCTIVDYNESTIGRVKKIKHLIVVEDL